MYFCFNAHGKSCGRNEHLERNILNPINYIL